MVKFLDYHFVFSLLSDLPDSINSPWVVAVLDGYVNLWSMLGASVSPTSFSVSSCNSPFGPCKYLGCIDVCAFSQRVPGVLLSHWRSYRNTCIYIAMSLQGRYRIWHELRCSYYPRPRVHILDKQTSIDDFDI